MIRLGIHAVGRLRGGPERALIDDYLTRAEKTGRALGVGPVTVTEVEDKKGGGMGAEADLLSASIPDGSPIRRFGDRRCGRRVVRLLVHVHAKQNTD